MPLHQIGHAHIGHQLCRARRSPCLAHSLFAPRHLIKLQQLILLLAPSPHRGWLILLLQRHEGENGVHTVDERELALGQILSLGHRGGQRDHRRAEWHAGAKLRLKHHDRPGPRLCHHLDPALLDATARADPIHHAIHDDDAPLQRLPHLLHLPMVILAREEQRLLLARHEGQRLQGGDHHPAHRAAQGAGESRRAGDEWLELVGRIVGEDERLRRHVLWRAVFELDHVDAIHRELIIHAELALLRFR
mmetsp:Transcript_71272/g.158431  ORF Transcript_71272/g.158431 Transcript_71272/m.158431 type:complete len:248 (-) Transcript_71272:627-1370(-)